MSKKLAQNIDGGLWVPYGQGEYIASVYRLDITETSPSLLCIQYHKGDMPAFERRCFNTLEDLETAMRKIEPDLRKWRTEP